MKNPRLKFVLIALLAIPCAAQERLNGIPAVQRNNALQLEKQGKLAEAQRAWTEISRLHPSASEPYAHLAMMKAHEGLYKEAIPFYRKALLRNPDVPGLRMNYALALFKSEDLRGALPELGKCLRAAPPESAEAQRLNMLIGMSHYGLAEYAEAVPFFRKAAAADRQNLPLRLVLAHSCLWSKQNQCVLDTYKEILTLDPDSAEACILAGEALDNMGDTSGAIEQFRTAIRVNPQQLGAHFGLGYLLWTQKDFDGASEQLNAELALSPDHGQSLLYLGDIAIKQNRFTDARPFLDRAEKLLPDEALVHRDLGIALSESGQADEAIRELQEAARLDPSDADAHWRLSRIYRSRGNTEAATAELAKTRKLKDAEHQELFRKLANARPPGLEQVTAPPQ